MMRGFMASDLEGIPVLGRVLARAGLRSLIAVGEFRRPGRPAGREGCDLWRQQLIEDTLTGTAGCWARTTRHFAFDPWHGRFMGR
jgi:hypothetical protein